MKMLATEKDRLDARYLVHNEKECNVRKSAGADAQESIDVVDYAFTKVMLDCDQQQHCKQSAQRQIDDKIIKRANPSLVPNQRSPQYSLPPASPSEKTATLATHLWTTSIDRKIARFQFPRKKSEPNCIKERPKFVRCSSIARLFGNTYNTQQPLQQLNQQQQQQQKLPHKDDTHSTSSTPTTTTNSMNKSRPSKCERFKKRSEHQIENISATSGEHNANHHSHKSIDSKDFCAQDDKDLSGRALRSLSKSLGRLWRRSHSIEISPPDPEYKVLYLGNVLTGWAKGDSCVEKPLTTLWRNYTQNHKPDVVMRIQVCPSGLKATTRQHGLTEYWSNRITHCNSPKNYPRIFCWIYRHEGRKLKHELRCHAVLCPKETIAEQICKTLKENISRALQEFKRDKISRQNARLSLVNSVYDNPSMPRRKILLSVGANNYRPPMERSKSAPKLMAIEEAVGEEEEEMNDVHEKAEESRPSCCKVVDPLFPAMTLGRKHCRRGHSIRRTKNNSERMRSISFDDKITITQGECGFGTYHKRTDDEFAAVPSSKADRECTRKLENKAKRDIGRCAGGDDDEDEFNSLLMVNDYDSQSSLSGELMSYFDSKLKLKSAVSMSDLSARPSGDLVSMTTELYGNRIALSLDNLDQYSDEGSENDSNGGKYRSQHYYDDDADDDVECDEDEDIDESERSSTFYDQNEVIDCLVNVSHKAKKGDEQNRATTDTAIKKQSTVGGAIGLDSDEGSISSGCETSSTVTTTHFDDVLRGERDSPPTNDNHLCAINRQDFLIAAATKTMRNESMMRRKCTNGNEEDCNSEMSDESGFDEYQNFVGKNTKLLMSHEVNGNSIHENNNNNKHMVDDIVDSNNGSLRHNKINDKNNNSNCRPFNDESNNNKDPSRLMINFPKNAKSILI